MEVSRVTNRYIFYTDGTRANANSQSLTELLQQAENDVKFYDRMASEVTTRYNEYKAAFETPPTTPTENEARAGILEGVAEIIKEANTKSYKALHIVTQCRQALNINGKR